MADKLTVKPATGLKIPNPDTGRDLAAEGESVPNTTYWRRLIRDGSVTAATITAGKKGK